MSVANDADDMAPFHGEPHLGEIIDQVKDLDERLESLQDEVSISQITNCSNQTLLIVNATMFLFNAIVLYSSLANK